MKVYAIALPFILAAVVHPSSMADEESMADDRQDIVFWDDTRPWLIRLHLSIDGQPFQGAWREFMRCLLTRFDYDGNGSLDATEIRRVPLPQFLYADDPFFSDRRLLQMEGRVISLRAVDRSPADGKVSLKELTEAYRHFGGGPFQIRFGPHQGEIRQDLNDQVFDFVDSDRDGQWTKNELADAGNRFGVLDFNEDEILSDNEFRGELGPNADSPISAENDTIRPLSNDVGPMSLVVPGPRARLLFRQKFLSHYALADFATTRRPRKRSEVRLHESTFDQLDGNQDSMLDDSEIEKFLERTPDFEQTLNLAMKSEWIVAPSQTVRLRIQVSESWDPSTYLLNNRKAVQESYRRQFQHLDANNDGHLEASEVSTNRILRDFFTRMDTDSDGQLLEKEMLGFVATIQDLQIQAVASVCSATVVGSQTSLFDIIDSNQDGRLTTREFKEASRNLSKWELDGDGRLGRGEWQRTFEVHISRGVNSLSHSIRSHKGMEITDILPETQQSSGPRWFLKMDCNRDGDVSRREFLGTKKQFEELDADGDGLISSSEAERAGKK